MLPPFFTVLEKSFILMLLVAFRAISINRWNLISQPSYLHGQIASAAVTPFKMA